jgi:protein phosphatase
MSHSSDTVELHREGRDRPTLLSALTRVDIGGTSHTGKVRTNNEDHFFVARFGRFLERLLSNLPEEEIPRLFEEIGYGAVVADGIGGHSAGEEASKLAVTTLIHLVLGTPDWILRFDDEQLPEEVKRRTAERFEQIGAVLADEAHADPNLEGFGTTMTLAVSLGKTLIVAHIGDSRAYLLRGGKLYRLTRDHTLAQELADEGRIGQQEVARSRLRHVLTRSLSAKGGPIEPDVQELALQDGDSLLLCTDGLTEMVQEDRIAEVLRSGELAEKACQQLIDDALAGGGKDNVTVVVVRYRFPPGS